MIDVAVHIVTHNNASTIAHVLDALARQVGNFIIQIIDNASTDGTCDIIKSRGISLKQNNKNLGYSVAHNQAIQCTSSRYVLTLNPDVILQEGFISHMINIMDNHPHVGMASGLLLRIDNILDEPTTIDSAGLYLLRNRRQGLRAENEMATNYPTKPAYIFGADGSAAFYNRQMLEDIKINGEVFDSDFFIHKEDIDLCWRSQWRGWQSLYVPNAVAHHIRTFRPGQRKNISTKLKYYALRNRYLLILKNDVFQFLIQDLVYILIYEIGIWLYVLLFEREALKIPIELYQTRQVWLNKRRNIKVKQKIEEKSLRYWYKNKQLEIQDKE